MRRTILILTVMAAAIAVLHLPSRLLAQQPRPKLPLAEVLAPEKHLPAVQTAAQSTPPVVFDATRLGSPLTLDKNWRVGVTANSAAAAAGFDDSKWVVRNAGDSLDNLEDLDRPAGSRPDAGAADMRPRHARPFVWFRLHLQLAPNHGPVALLIALPVSQNTTMSIGANGPGVDVFANGRQIQPSGPNGNAANRYQEVTRLYDLGLSPTDTSLTLVVRTIYIPFGLASYTNFFANRTLRIGYTEDLNRELELWSVHNLFEHLPRLVNGFLLIVLSIFLLALYFTQKGHIEYLWLALHELLQAPIGFIDLAGSTAKIDQLWYAALVLELVVVSAYLYFEFLIAFLALRKRWYILVMRYTAPILAGVGPTLLFVGQSPLIGVLLAVVYLGSLVWMIGWAVFISTTLIGATLRRNFEAGLLLIPLVLTIVGIVEPILTGGVSGWEGRPFQSPLTIQAGEIPIHFASIADFAGLLAIVIIIFFRFLRIHNEQERTSSELAAARSVQELMIPKQKQETPGYEVDSVYTPAHEVGGDFYYVQPMGEKGLLVVIGDVAGKGLKAAMNVSMLMGALRQAPERGPAKILESLNSVLSGSESLTTCQVALFDGDGGVTLSNAGHLPPYLNSQEIALPGGLPLGAIPQISYDEISLYLHPGDRLLLLSDGVVEARQASGELFGFERVHNLSNQSAFYIADAAKEFGQEDDITVVTVRRLAEVLAA